MKSFDTIQMYGRVVVALAIMAVASTDALAADKKAKGVEDWEIRGAKGYVMTNTAYALRNITNSKYLHWNSGAIDLKWDTEHKPRTEPKPRIAFYTAFNGAKPSPLKFGDQVAIGLPGNAPGKVSMYLVYKKKGKGINLTFEQWSGLHWEVQGGPKGTPVPTNAKIALYNHVTKDYVIYAEREHGINLNWNGVVNPPRDHRTKK